MSKSFSHFDGDGASRMVDVGEKPITDRVAVASGRVEMQSATLAKIRSGVGGEASKDQQTMEKGNVLEVARLAGIMAAKQTGNLIPLCHPLALDAVKLDFEFEGDSAILIQAMARVRAKTGVEMEALTAVSVAALTIYDMCKSVDRSMQICQVRLESKSGGRSGEYRRGATSDE